MPLLAQLVVAIAVDLTDLQRDMPRATALVQKFEAAASAPQKVGEAFTHASQNVAKFTSSANAASSSASSLAAAQAKAAVAAGKIKEAEAQAALALKKVEDLQVKGKASAEQIAVAQAKAATAANKVKVAETAAATALEKVKAAAEKSATGMNKAAESGNRLDSSLSRVRSVAVSVSSSLTSVGRAASAGGSSFLDFGSKLGMSVIGLQGLAMGIMGVGKALIGGNASMEQARVSYMAFLGDAKVVDQFLRDLANFAAKTPFEFEDIQSAGLKLLNMGVAAKDAQKWLTDVGNAVAKVGGNGETLNDVSAILSQMALKGKVTGEEMMQLSERNIPAFKILADAMGVPVDQLQQMISKGQVGKDKIDLLVESMGKWGNNAMIAQGETFNGMMSSLIDNAKLALQTFSQPLFDMSKSGLKGLGDFLSSDAFQNFASGAGKALGDTLQNISMWVSTFLDTANDEGLGIFIGSLQTLGETVGKILAPAFESAGNALSGFFSQEGAEEAGLALSSAFYDIADVIYIVNDAIKAGHETWVAMQPVLEQIGAFLVETFAPVWDQLQKTLNEHIIPAWNDLVAGIEPVMPQLQIVGAIIAGLVVGALGGLVAMLGKVLEGIAQFVGGAIEWISGLVQFWSGTIAFIVSFVTGDFEGMRRALETMMGGIGRMFKGSLEMIQGLWKAVIGSMQAFADGFVKSIVGFFKWLWDQVVGHSIIPDMVKGIIKWFGDLGKNGLKAIQDFVSNIQKAITDFAAKCIQFGKDIVNNIINGITSLAGNIGGAIKGAIKSAAASVGITIPGFAGGVTDFAGGLAVVGEKGPELVYLPQHSSVIPMNSSPAKSSNVSPSRSSKSNATGDLYISLEVDGQHLAHIVAPHIDGRVRAKFGPRGRVA